jgi:hypothetical protein
VLRPWGAGLIEVAGDRPSDRVSGPDPRPRQKQLYALGPEPVRGAGCGTVSALRLPAPPQTVRERQAAQAELAYLRTYSVFYRAHLRAYTEGILRGIEEWERKEAASFQEAVRGQADNRSIGR